MPQQTENAAVLPDTGRNPNGDVFEPAQGGDLSPDAEALPFRHFDPVKDTPKSALIFIQGARRQGKTETVLSMLRAWKAAKRFTHYFVYSQTGQGYSEYIPQSYHFENLDTLPDVLNRQQDVADYNKDVKDKRDMIKSSLCIILDDMVGDTRELRTGDSGRLINKIAVNGRHVVAGDPNQKNEVVFIIIAQRATLLPPSVRANADLTFSSKHPNQFERERLVLENLTLKSGRDGKKEGYEVFDRVVSSKPYRFIVLANHVANRRHFEDFVMYSDGDPTAKPGRLFGTDQDWAVKPRRINF